MPMSCRSDPRQADNLYLHDRHVLEALATVTSHRHCWQIQTGAKTGAKAYSTPCDLCVEANIKSDPYGPPRTQRLQRHCPQRQYSLKNRHTYSSDHWQGLGCEDKMPPRPYWDLKVRLTISLRGPLMCRQLLGVADSPLCWPSHYYANEAGQPALCPLLC